MTEEENKETPAPETPAPETPEPETPPVPTPEPEPTPEQIRIKELEAENEKLKNPPPPEPSEPQRVTSETLMGLREEQWQEIEAKNPGKDRMAIINEVRNYEITQRQNAIDAKTNTSEAINDAIEANPKLIKLRGAIKEFMEDIPVADRLNPAKLKRAMEKAVIYAKGKYMTTNPDTPRPTPNPKHNDNPSPKGGTEEEGGEDYAEGEVKPDVYTSNEGHTIKIGKVDRKLMKRIQHDSDPNGVKIPMDFDKPPIFK